VGGDVAPPIQQSEVVQACNVAWMCGRQVESKAKALEIVFQVLEVRVTVAKFPVSRELGLEKTPKACPDLRCDDLGAFGVEVPAGPLELGAEKEHVPAYVLLG